MSEIEVKDPEATRTYTVDWTDYLISLGTGITLVASEWAVPEGITQEGDAIHTDTAAKIKLSGGSRNTDYTLYNKITTSGGDVDRRALVIQVRDAATFTETSDAETQLAAVRLALGKVSSKNTLEYQIAGRMKRQHSIPDLLALESSLIRQVNRERRATRMREGKPLFTSVAMRFK